MLRCHLAKHRVHKNMSQEKLAEHLDVSRLTVSNIERGKHEPSIGLALLAAHVLEVPVTELFQFQETIEELVERLSRVAWSEAVDKVLSGNKSNKSKYHPKGRRYPPHRR